MCVGRSKRIQYSCCTHFKLLLDKSLDLFHQRDTELYQMMCNMHIVFNQPAFENVSLGLSLSQSVAMQVAQNHVSASLLYNKYCKFHNLPKSRI